ncbi:MAG: hypothetical protein H7A24_15165 [Leptospiraceae bacterium]|nr:hypothetical protein [Leptospiraceae bacterium]MCP5513225.1 hypothetical protein [Leptospiraceae bacterium]
MNFYPRLKIRLLQQLIENFKKIDFYLDTGRLKSTGRFLKENDRLKVNLEYLDKKISLKSINSEVKAEILKHLEISLSLQTDLDLKYSTLMKETEVELVRIQIRRKLDKQLYGHKS